MKQKYLKQWSYPSKSDPSKTYIVSLKQDGEYICSCWPYLKTRKPCKHILEAMKENVDEQTPQNLEKEMSLQEILELLFGAKI